MTAKKQGNGASTIDDAAAVEAMEAFEQFAALGPGIQVQISRMPGAKYLELQPLEGLDCDLMRARYGGGSFSLRARQDGKWMKGVPIRHVEIEGVPKEFPPPIVETTAAAEVKRLQGEIDQLTAPGGPDAPPPAATGSDAMMVTMMGALTTIVTTMLTAQMERSNPTSALEILDLARKLGKDMRKGEPDSDPIAALGLPLLAEIRELRKLEASKTDAPKAITPPEPSKPKVPETAQELAEFIASYCAPHARAGANPALRAEVFLEDLYLQNPPLADSVVELSRVPGVLSHWVGMVPAVADNREWYEDFIREIRELAAAAEADPDTAATEGEPETDQDGAPDDPARGSRDAGDGPGDGGTSEVGAPE